MGTMPTHDTSLFLHNGQRSTIITLLRTYSRLSSFEVWWWKKMYLFGCHSVVDIHLVWKLEVSFNLRNQQLLALNIKMFCNCMWVFFGLDSSRENRRYCKKMKSHDLYTLGCLYMANSNLFLEHILIEISWFSSQQPKKKLWKNSIIFPLNSIKRIGDATKKTLLKSTYFNFFSS